MADPTYTVFVRVPIPRGDFVDPPPVDWDSSKDEALWKILSGAAQTEIDWNKVADRFNAPVDFLLKQVAFLTDRHASQVRAQVRKATAAAKGSNAPSPIPGSASGLSQRKEVIGSGSGTPLNASLRPVISRNPSNNTTILRDVAGSASPRPGTGRSGGGRSSLDQVSRRRLSSLPITTNAPPAQDYSPPAEEENRSPSPGPAESSSPTTDEESEPAQSRIIRRPPRFRSQDTAHTYDGDEDDDEDEPAFQPYKPKGEASSREMSSTLRGDGRSSISKRTTKSTGKQPVRHSHTSDSDNSSPAKPSRASNTHEQRPSGPLSPRRTAELSGRSPSAKSDVRSREGSDGTPSMGSSFSDLDDASVTQSALEEALASQLNRPGGGSRFSNIGQAFRSRYG